MELLFKGITDIGLVREMNQDSYGMYQNGNMTLLCLADGMGGHEHGELASQAITAGMEEWSAQFNEAFFQNKFGNMINSLVKKVQEINDNIFDTYNINQITGSTMILLLFYEGQYALVSAGDSRIYKAHGFSFKQLTEDDVWESLEENQIHYTKEELENHPNRGMLMRAVGIRPRMIPEVKVGRVKAGDVFLMCSDGLTKVIPERKIHKYLRKSRGESQMLHSLECLKEEVYENGAPDNFTIIICRAKLVKRKSSK